MYARNPRLQTALRRALYTTISIPAVALIAPNVMAQEQAELEEITVTGSRIARDPNVGANVPVTSITGDDIQLSGDIDISEVLNDMPSLLGSNSATNSAYGVFGTGSGSSETAGSSEVGESILQLRGLGVERTLVLVNGRRHVSGVAGSQAVDIGSIPQQLVERVDVLTGGASAIYGADAVTGVVNFIMKDDYEGLNVNLSGGMSGEGDAENLSVSAIYGTNFADNRGNIAFAVDYVTREPLLHGERSWSRNNGVANDDQNPALRFQSGEIDAANTPNFARFYAPSTAFASTDPPCDLFDYNYCYGFHPVGMPILSADDFTNLWQQAFPGDPDPVFTSAEQALIDRAATAPNRLINSQHNFSLSAPGGVLLPGSIWAPGIDIDTDGTSDCFQSYMGNQSTFDKSPPLFGFIGGCWIIQDDGVVRPLQDGLIAGDINQFGADGIADWFDADSLIPDDWRASVNVLGHFDVSNDMTFFWEAKYSEQETTQANPLNTFWDLLTIAPDNPYISQLPPDLAAVGMAEGFFITRDPTDLGPNRDVGTRQTARFVIGIEGEFDNGWNYEFSANYGSFKNEFKDGNRVIVDRWFAAIDAVDDGSGNVVCRSDIDPTPPPTTPFQIPAYDPGFFTFNPGDGSCQPANILGGAGAISDAAVDFITDTVVNTFETDQFVFSGVVTGEWGETSAGPIGFAAGVEIRSERSQAKFDPLVRGVLPVTTLMGQEGDLLSDIAPRLGVDSDGDGISDFDPNVVLDTDADGESDLAYDQRSLVFDSESLTQDVKGSYDVADIFAEVSIPLLEGKSFAENLTFDAAVRFSDYSTIGSTLTWKAGGSWTPVSDSLRLRGSYSVSVRAPNINELFSPSQGAFFRPDDPCDVNQITALIDIGDARGPIRQANCAAAGISPTFTDPLTARFVGETRGNPDLQEEESEAYSFGFIFSPEFLEGLTISADFWDITIDDAIDAPSGQSIVDSCYDSLAFPDNQFCALVRRNPDPTSPQFNGLEFISQQQLNIGKLEATGVDFAIQYRFDVGASDLRLGLNGTWMDKLDRFFDPTNPAAVDPELGELQRPEWAGNFTAEWALGPIAVAYQMHYQDEQGLRAVEIETAAINYGPAGIADSVTIHDISVAWDISDRYRLYGGINNFTDEEPFITELAYPVSPVGTFFFLGLEANFLQ
jgi:outer membrane receptor protein involved in Fe transport